MNVATIGGTTLGAGLVLYRGVIWWPGLGRLRKDAIGSAMAILPFLYAWAYGALLVMCSGGILSWMADATLWAGNWAGDTALVWGIGGSTAEVTRGSAQILTNGGHSIVLLGTFLLAALLRRGKVDSKVVGHGLLSGILLGLVGGLPGQLVVTLASLANLAGAWNTEVLT